MQSIRLLPSAAEFLGQARCKGPGFERARKGPVLRPEVPRQTIQARLARSHPTFKRPADRFCHHHTRALPLCALNGQTRTGSSGLREADLVTGRTIDCGVGSKAQWWHPQQGPAALAAAPCRSHSTCICVIVILSRLSDPRPLLLLVSQLRFCLALYFAVVHPPKTEWPSATASRVSLLSPP